MATKLFLSLGVAFAIVSQSQALLGQDVETETHLSHKIDRRIEDVPSQVRRAPHIKVIIRPSLSLLVRHVLISKYYLSHLSWTQSEARIAQKIRDLGGTSTKKTKKSAKSMSKHVKSKKSKGEDGNEGDDSDGSDSNGSDSDGSDGNDLPEKSDFDISDCGSYSNEW